MTAPLTSSDHALVLFSGGQDSATCLAWALEHFAHVETLGFDYGQRHRIELEMRAPLREAIAQTRPHWVSRLGEDHRIDLSVLGQISDTALTQSRTIEFDAQGLPNTFVPGRNLLFFTFAATIAWRRGLRVLVGGMCETDYSGYPDCRDDTLKSLQVTLGLGMATRFRLETPLMWLDKAATWQLTESLGGAGLVEVIRSLSHSCYLGERSQSHAWGSGCGACPACDLRARGWLRYQDLVASPLRSSALP